MMSLSLLRSRLEGCLAESSGTASGGGIFAMGGGRVYVTNESSGTVLGRAKDGTGLEELVTDGQTRPHSMVATKHCVYWRDDTDNGTIWTRGHQPPAP